MFDIVELIDIINQCNGEASLDDIASIYRKKHKMAVLSEHKAIFAKILKTHANLVEYSSLTGKWYIPNASFQVLQLPFLRVSDSRFFSTIAEVMLYCFDKRVPNSQGYFDIGEGKKAWFPQPNNKNWRNALSGDGRTWYETPLTPESTYNPDNCQRYVFEHTEEGYRFTGLFLPHGIDETNTRIYELIDDKVPILSMKKRLVVCRVAYMKFYDGITDEDVPVNGGSFVSENNDAYEKNNFHHYEDGFCYGFVETKYKKGHQTETGYAKSIAIENINPACKNVNHVDDVTVVLVAYSNELRKTVIVGWYDSATIYRDRIIDGEKTYMMKCTSANAHLIPHEQRSFEVPKASEDHFGIGQSNFWYIQNNPEAKNLESQILSYIDACRNNSESQAL